MSIYVLSVVAFDYCRSKLLILILKDAKLL